MRVLLYVLSLSTLLRATGSVSPARSEVLVQISKAEAVSQVVEIHGVVWLATDTGAFRVEGETAVPVMEGLAVTMISEAFSDQIWLGTERGLFRVERNAVQPLFLEEIGRPWISVLKRSENGSIWLGTSQRGLYYVEENGLLTPIFNEGIRTLNVLDGEVWVGTRENAYSVASDGKSQPAFDERKEVSEITRVGNDTWFITRAPFGRYGPCFRFDGTRAVEAISDPEVISVADIRGAAWFATTKGIFRLDRNSPVLVRDFGEPVNTVALVDDQVWALTTQQIYHEIGDTFEPVLPGSGALNLKGIGKIHGHIWTWGEAGVFRLDEDVDILVQLDTTSVFGQEVIFGSTAHIEGVRYDRNGSDPYDLGVTRSFGVIMRPDWKAFEEEVRLSAFTPSASLERIVPPGFLNLHIMARDAFGNVKRLPSRSILVIPYKTLIVVVPPLLWMLCLLLAVMTAPWYRPSMSFIMIPSIRRQGSLGIIPAVLSFAAARRYMLRRYVRNLLTSEDFSNRNPEDDWGVATARVSAHLVDHRRVLVSGEPRNTRRFLRSVTRALAKGRADVKILKKTVPIFLRLELYSDSKEKIEKGALWQLSDLGGITDLDLARDILHEDGFVFLLDGLGALNDDGLRSVEQFVDSSRDGNYFVIGANVEGPRPEGFCEIPLASLAARR